MVTNGGEKEIVSAAGSARVITPRSRQRAWPRARRPCSDGSNGVERILAGDELERADQRRAAYLADERMVGEGVAEQAMHQRAAGLCPRDEPLVLDEVEVRHRHGGRERMGGVRVAVTEGPLVEPSTSTRQTRSETMQPESGKYPEVSPSATVIRSGSIPKTSDPNQLPSRPNAVITSSAISSTS